MTYTFSQLLGQKNSFRNVLALDPKSNYVSFDKHFPEYELQAVFSNNGSLNVILTFVSLYDVWWSIRFVCKHWFKYCLNSRRIDFDGLAVEDFFFLNQKVTCFTLEDAFNDFMCHLCWTEPGKFGTISIITNVTSLSIYVKYQATLLRNDHLIQFAGIQRKNLKELNLIGRSNVTGYGFKQSFQVQETLESLSVIENHALEFCYLQHLPKLKRLEVNGCPYFLRESLDNKQAMSIVFFTDLTHVCCDVDYTKHLVQSSKNLLVVDWSSSNQGYSHADHNFAAKELIVRSHQICQDRPNLQMNCLKIIMDDRDWGKILLYTLTHLEKSANIPLHLPSSMKMYLELGIEILADSVEDKQSKTRMYFQQLLNSMYTVRDQNRKDSYDNNSTPIAYKYFKPSWLNDHNVQYGQQQLVELLKRMLSSN